VAVEAGTVLILITVAVVPIAAIAFARSGGAWGRVGRGRFAIDEQRPAPPESRSADAERALQMAEARQMLEAKSYRRVRDGGAPLDVEAEVRRLFAEERGATSADEELRAAWPHCSGGCHRAGKKRHPIPRVCNCGSGISSQPRARCNRAGGCNRSGSAPPGCASSTAADCDKPRSRSAAGR
jgi:hypothetical protein